MDELLANIKALEDRRGAMQIELNAVEELLKQARIEYAKTLPRYPDLEAKLDEFEGTIIDANFFGLKVYVKQITEFLNWGSEIYGPGQTFMHSYGGQTAEVSFSFLKGEKD